MSRYESQESAKVTRARDAIRRTSFVRGASPNPRGSRVPPKVQAMDDALDCILPAVFDPNVTTAAMHTSAISAVSNAYSTSEEPRS